MKAPDSRGTAADGKPGVFVMVTMTPSETDLMRYIRVQMLNVYDNGRGVMPTCSVSGFHEEKSQADRLHLREGADGVTEHREKTMMKGVRVAALAAGALLLASCAATGADGYAIYDTAKEPGALGIKAQVSYPAGFTSQADEARPTVIRIFRHEADGLDEHLLLQAMDLGNDAGIFFGDEADFDDSTRRAKWMYVLDSVPGTRVAGLRAATHAGRPAVFADLAVTRFEREEGRYLKSRMLMVQDKGKMLALTCGVNGRADEQEKIDLRQEANTESLCRNFFDSLKWMD